MINKEYGSDYHYFINEDVSNNETENISKRPNFSLYLSGRAALYGILKRGIEEESWDTVFFPSFYCHEVVEYIKRLPIRVLYYDFNPFLDHSAKEFSFADRKGNVIINVDFFGLVKWRPPVFENTVVIDDQTHNLLNSHKSMADYCFGSLRKELPVPVGGFLFSPKKKGVPELNSNIKAEEIALKKLSAMYLKKRYLFEEQDLDKENYRVLFKEAETEIGLSLEGAEMPELAKVIFKRLDIHKILMAKQDNLVAALRNLKDLKDIQINIDKTKNAFGLVLFMSSNKAREKLRMSLIQECIYPAVLWPDQITDRDKEVEGRILFIHIDYRYEAKDIEKITETVKKNISNA